jgi:hypothetical protein
MMDTVIAHTAQKKPIEFKRRSKKKLGPILKSKIKVKIKVNTPTRLSHKLFSFKNYGLIF